MDTEIRCARCGRWYESSDLGWVEDVVTTPDGDEEVEYLCPDCAVETGDADMVMDEIGSALEGWERPSD
ncbi:MAG TPA: hypothetical protein VMT10_08750 [Solirubrobacteraceae bacterium]|nr:hypothetical protein [Solirubrobacteraceae bacterium]HVP02644.1 hypothetical protein [Solirubrobacteraceae bacterium]